MRANELIELGWRVCGELVDEDNKKYLFVVEDDFILLQIIFLW